MSELRDTLLARLSEAYTAYFDVEPVQDGSPLKALCCLSLPRLSVRTDQKGGAVGGGDPRIPLPILPPPAGLHQPGGASGPHAGGRDATHPAPIPSICAPICRPWSCVIRPTPDALAQLQKLKKHRDFKLSLHGWMEFRIAAVDLSTGDIATNRSGKDLGKSLSGLVAREIQKFKLRRGET